MECNKEEAIRAKSIAESRMQSQDFEGALKIAVKARHLFPDLESISQILTVCEVHCAAGTKIGRERDWYAVLQVDMAADEPTIRKQYRKLALLLHPDKNKLAGAEGAFQLIGDAYKILSDPLKRSQHNMIRGANFSRVSLNQAARQSRPASKQPGPGVSSTAAKLNFDQAARQSRPAAKQPGPGVSSTAAAKLNFDHFSGLNQNQPSPFLGTGAFWTICPSCSVSFQYYKNVLNRQVRCQRCFNRFVAYDLKSRGVTSSGNSEKVGNTAPSTRSSMESQRAKSDNSAFNQGFKPEHSSDQEAKPLASRKRRGDENNQTPGLSADKASNLLRRSKRHKLNVTCDEVNADSSPPASKRPRQDEEQAGWARAAADEGREENGNRRARSEFSASVASRCESSVDPENLTYPSPEFCDFEGERCKSKFAVDQIWALYDNIDGMPRFYARVRKVYSREFKLQLNWLENDPRTIAEMKWSEKGLPVSCGSFKHGTSFNTQERHIFSHLVPRKNGMKRNSYVIYPRRGEIWALFRNWDIRWSSEPNNHRAYEYQIVEVVSDFTEAAGITVIRLAKIKEFMALFARAPDAEESLLEIPTRDLLVFSHRVPACRITGKEEDGVPEGAFELDCASLPTNFQDTFTFISLVTKDRTPNVGVECETKIPKASMKNGLEPDEQEAMEKWRKGTRGYGEKHCQDASTASQKALERESPALRDEVVTEAGNIGGTDHDSVPPSLLVFEYPDSEFYDFESDRSMGKFECGQVWAFYCEVDNFPKYYGRIRMIDRENSRVHVRWLESYSAADGGDRRAGDEPPPVCGAFRAIKETCTMHSAETFSHRVKAKPTATKGRYYIFPDVGEVWAVFKNWSADRSASGLKNGELEVVEISARDANGIKASVLTKVDGYVSVFSRESEGLDALEFISFSECSRFSHQIPAFKLEEEMCGGGGGGGHWELDPAAVPTVFLTPK